MVLICAWKTFTCVQTYANPYNIKTYTPMAGRVERSGALDSKVVDARVGVEGCWLGFRVSGLQGF